MVRSRPGSGRPACPAPLVVHLVLVTAVRPACRLHGRGPGAGTDPERDHRDGSHGTAAGGRRPHRTIAAGEPTSRWRSTPSCARRPRGAHLDLTRTPRRSEELYIGNRSSSAPSRRGSTRRRSGCSTWSVTRCTRSRRTRRAVPWQSPATCTPSPPKAVTLQVAYAAPPADVDDLGLYLPAPPSSSRSPSSTARYRRRRDRGGALDLSTVELARRRSRWSRSPGSSAVP